MNTTSFSLLSSGGISGEVIITGSFFNGSHVVLATENAQILMISNLMTVSWQQQHFNLGSGLQISVIDSLIFWLTS